MSEQSNSVEQCVERLCRAGCREVSHYITLLREDLPVPGIEGLSPGERARVLQELESVMAAYAYRCGGGDDVPGTD